jgi:hypothetical protein
MQWKNTAPYRLTTQQELYRTGYRNYRHSGILVTAAIAAFLLGTFVDASEKALVDVLPSHSERAINPVPIPASRKIAFRLLADTEDDFRIYTQRSDSGKHLPCSWNIQVLHDARDDDGLRKNCEISAIQTFHEK